MAADQEIGLVAFLEHWNTIQDCQSLRAKLTDSKCKRMSRFDDLRADVARHLEDKYADSECGFLEEVEEFEDDDVCDISDEDKELLFEQETTYTSGRQMEEGELLPFSLGISCNEMSIEQTLSKTVASPDHSEGEEEQERWMCSPGLMLSRKRRSHSIDSNDECDRKHRLVLEAGNTPESYMEETTEGRQEAVDGKEQEVEDNRQEVEDREQEVDDNRQEVEDRGQEVDNNRQEVEDRGQEVADNRQEVEDRGQEVEDRGQEVDDTKPEVDTTEQAVVDQIDNREREVVDIKQDVDDIKQEVDDITQEVDDITQDVDDIEQEVKGREQEVDEDVDDIKQEVDDIEQEVKGREQEVDDMQYNIDNGEQEAEERKQKVEAIKHEFDDGEQKVKDREKEVDDGEQKVKDREKEVDDGEQKVKDREKEVKDREKEVDDGEQKVHSHSCVGQSVFQQSCSRAAPPVGSSLGRVVGTGAVGRLLFGGSPSAHVTPEAVRRVVDLLQTEEVCRVSQVEEHLAGGRWRQCGSGGSPGEAAKKSLQFLSDLGLVESGQGQWVVECGLQDFMALDDEPVATTTELEPSMEDVFEYVSFAERSRRSRGLKMAAVVNHPSHLEQQVLTEFRTSAGGRVREFCQEGTKEECRRARAQPQACPKLHFHRIIQRHTDESLGDCSFLNACFNRSTCKYVHYEADQSFDDPEEAKAHANLPRDSYFKLYVPQWIDCDIRYLDFSVLGKFAVIMADPPWDIHMELPYGTMSDDEMRCLKVPDIQDEGLIFLWVTGRAMELGRECLLFWGYERVDELVWVKVNQRQRLIRTGRTGHWLNHSKEHCLIGVKGRPTINRGLDCDVLLAEVRATSHKPDEIYGLIERLSPGTRKLEIFGRQHNCQSNWVTLGNQLNGSNIWEPDMKERFYAKYPTGVVTAPTTA